MAMTYQNFASLGVNLNRQKYGPLDISNVFTSAADLKYYLTKGTFTEGVSEYWYKNANEKVVPYPYEGQVLATVINGVVSVYALSLDADGNFQTQEIGAKVEVDGTTIVKDASGKLSIVAPINPDSSKTYNFAYANGVYSWVEVDTATAAGQAQEINSLKSRASALENTVNGTDETEGLVAKVAALEAVDNATQAELDAYKEVVTAAIAAGVQEAKNYADENDANTIYDDSDIKSRLSAIENDYLKTEDKYDDTALAGRVTAVEGVAAGNTTAIADEKTRAEAAEKALGERIDAIDFVDGDELASAIAASEAVVKKYAEDYTDGEIGKIEEAIGKLNHFTAKVVSSTDEMTEVGVLYLLKDLNATGSDVYEEYIVIDGTATLIGDTTTDLSDYYDKDEIGEIVEAINSAISVEKTAREALADRVKALEDVDNATQAELDAYKTEVEGAIATAKSEAIADADGKLADKVNISDFETFKSTNTQAIADAKAGAIADAAKAVEDAGFAVAAQVAETYATKTALETLQGSIENELVAYAKSADVNSELATKVETATISHSTEEKAEGITKNGTQLDIVVDAFTKAETRQYVADTIKTMTGGESAADVKLLLENHIADYEEKVGQIDAKDAAQDTAITAAQSQADKGVADAAKVAADLVAANQKIDDNTREIGVNKSSIETVNTTLSGKITALEIADAKFTSDITALETLVKGEGGHASRITALESRASVLESKDTELAASIKANADKFANYYTTTQVDAKVQEAIDAIPEIDLKPYAKAADVASALALKADQTALDAVAEDLAEEIERAKAAEKKIADDLALLIENPTDALDSVKELIEHVQKNGSDVAGIITRLDGHDSILAGVEGTVVATIDSKIAAAAYELPVATAEILGGVKSSAAENGVAVAADGTMSVNSVNVNKLVQTAGEELVLNGGKAK